MQSNSTLKTLNNKLRVGDDDCDCDDDDDDVYTVNAADVAQSCCECSARWYAMTFVVINRYSTQSIYRYIILFFFKCRKEILNTYKQIYLLLCLQNVKKTKHNKNVFFFVQT